MYLRSVQVYAWDDYGVAGSDTLLVEPHGLAAQAIMAQQVTLDSVREAVATALQPGGGQAPPALIPYDA